MSNIELKAGQVVIMTSGTFYHRYVMARIYGDPTPKRVRVQHWERRADDWERVPSVRDRASVIAVVTPDAEPSEVYQRLQEAYSAAETTRKQAEAAHTASIQQIARGEAPQSSTSEIEQALFVFAACARDLAPEEPDDGWARFRLLVSDYRRARRCYVKLTGKEPPYPEDAHAALSPLVED